MISDTVLAQQQTKDRRVDVKLFLLGGFQRRNLGVSSWFLTGFPFFLSERLITLDVHDTAARRRHDDTVLPARRNLALPDARGINYGIAQQA